MFVSSFNVVVNVVNAVNVVDDDVDVDVDVDLILKFESKGKNFVRKFLINSSAEKISEMRNHEYGS